MKGTFKSALLHAATILRANTIAAITANSRKARFALSMSSIGGPPLAPKGAAVGRFLFFLDRRHAYLKAVKSA